MVNYGKRSTLSQHRIHIQFSHNSIFKTSDDIDLELVLCTSVITFLFIIWNIFRLLQSKKLGIVV